MERTESSVDYLQISPLRALCTICFPLLLVNGILVVTTTWTNTLYSQYAGQTYFTVAGYLSIAISLFGSVISSVYTSAWIKIAPHHNIHSKDKFSFFLENALLAMLLACLACAALFMAVTRLVLTALHVPEAFLGAARLYYLVYLGTYLPMALAALLLTVINGISGARGIFFVNLVAIFANLAAAILLLAVLQWNLVGAVLCGAGGGILHLAFYWFWFRRAGYFRQIRNFSPNWKLIGEILRYSGPMIMQNVLSILGALFVSLQTNRLLSSDYITVLSVDLPMANMMVAFGVAIMIFTPQNFAAGQEQRVRRFLKLAVGCALTYGVCCFLFYSMLGGWYYGKLFQDVQIVSYGKGYWFWRGVGFIPLAILYTMRYFANAVGQNRLTMFSGLGELLGNSICAFWLIPCFGTIGRSLTDLMGWSIAGGILLCCLFYQRRKIFQKHK